MRAYGKSRSVITISTGATVASIAFQTTFRRTIKWFRGCAVSQIVVVETTIGTFRPINTIAGLCSNITNDEGNEERDCNLRHLGSSEPLDKKQKQGRLKADKKERKKVKVKVLITGLLRVSKGEAQTCLPDIYLVST